MDVVARYAKLGLAGSLAMVRAVEDGLSLKAATAAFSVSPATVHRWLAGDRPPLEPAAPLASSARGGAAGTNL